MRHKLIGAVAVLAVVAGAALAADKGDKDTKGRKVTGLIKKVDPSGKEIILSVVTKDKSEMEQRVKIGPDSKLILSGKDKKPLTGNDVFTCPKLKEGARATVVLDEENRAAEIRLDDLSGKEDRK